MMRLGCALIVLGFGLLVAGVVWVGVWVFDSWGAREVVRIPVPSGHPLISDVVTVTPNSRCEIEVAATIHAEKGELRQINNPTGGDDEHFVPRFRFPVVYHVKGEDGTELASHAGALGDGDGEHESLDFAGVGPKGGTGRARVRFPVFNAPASGKLRVEMTLFPDEGNGARVESPSVAVFDKVPQSPETTTVAFLTPFVGLGVLAVGVVVFVVGFFVWLVRQMSDAPPARVIVVRG
jgi:hypothetical protein